MASADFTHTYRGGVLKKQITEKGRLLIKKPGKIIVSIGKPIPSTGRAPGELMAEVENWIESEMRVITPGAYAHEAASATAAAPITHGQ